MPIKATVIGDGGWGTALAMVLDRNGNDVTVWGAFADYTEQIKATRVNSKFLPGVTIPESINWTNDRAAAVEGAELIILAAPSKYLKEVCKGFKGLITQDQLVICVAKGIDPDEFTTMSETAQNTLGIDNVMALSGPSHAEEVSRNIPTAVVLASSNIESAERAQAILTDPRFRVYTSSDVIGVELGGALKNVIAVAVGISDGLGFGDNTRAALITRGLAEMKRLGLAVDAQRSTFSGLSGMGDLIVTCASGLSRNRSVGERLGRGEALQDIIDSMAQVAEGVWNCVSAKGLADKLHVDVPIISEVYAILYEGKDPELAVSSLLSRDVKPED